MGQILVANRHGHQALAWPDTDTDTEDARQLIAAAENLLEEARAHGALIARKVEGQYVLDRTPFDPAAEEYQIIAPLVGG